MEFKEFLAFEEEKQLFRECDQIDENWLTGPFKFVGGAASNAGIQTGRGLGNLAKGVARGIDGAVETGVGGLQYLGGGGKKAKKKLGSGVSKIATGGGEAIKGIAQLGGALSGITPLIRGAQASTERFGPMSSKRNWLQKTFGLNAEEPEITKPPKASKSPKSNAPQKSKSPKSPKSPKKVIQDKEEWDRLVYFYQITDDPVKKAELQEVLKKRFPKKYQAAVTRAARLRVRKDMIAGRTPNPIDIAILKTSG